MKSVCTVVVTFNRLELLRSCLAAVRAQSRAADRILVVNNGSTDGTAEWLDNEAAIDGNLEVIHQDNLGGAGGFHVGIRHAVEQGANFVWIMDDDVLPSARALERLLAKQEQFPQAGFYCSLVQDSDGNCVNTPVVANRLNASCYSHWQDDLKDGVIWVEACTFVSVLISESVISRAGLPFSEYFIWGDDSEFSLRIAKAHGRPGLLVGDSVVTHARRFSQPPSIFSEGDPDRLQLHFYGVRNRLHTDKLHGTKSFAERLVWILGVLKAILLAPDRRLQRLGIFIRALYASLTFKPKLRFPSER